MNHPRIKSIIKIINSSKKTDERENKEYKLSKDCKFYLREIDGFVQSAHEVDYYTFINELNTREMKPPFWVKFDGNTVVELVEIYIKA